MSQKGYTTGKWQGAELHQCDACQFNTLDQSTIERHVRNVHPEGEAAPAAARTTSTRRRRATTPEE